MGIQKRPSEDLRLDAGCVVAILFILAFFALLLLGAGAGR